MIKVVAQEVRLSFVNLLEPRSPGLNDDGTPQAPKYSAQLLIPKDTAKGKATYAALRKAEETAKEQDKGKWGGRIPKNLKSIIHDGDTEGDTDKYPELEGHWYMSVNTSTKYPPKVVDRKLQPILDATEVYSGIWANVSLQAYGYAVQGSSGVSFGLGNVQKLRDGEPLGGVAARPEDEFDDLGDEDDALI